MSIKQNNKSNNRNLFRIKKKKGLFIISLIIAIIIENSIILYVYPIENKIVYTNWILIINSAIAAVFSILLVINIVLKQKFLDYNLKIHIAFAIGLLLWLSANIQWVIYENDEIVPPVPSNADYLWLSAYPFLGYSLYSTFKRFYKKSYNKKVFLITIGCGILSVVYIFYNITRLSEFSISNDISLFSTMITYTILNTILIIPGIMILIGFKKKPESSMPRMCESLSLLTPLIVDSYFVTIFLSNIIEAVWYSNLFTVDSYLIISAGLLWSLVFLYPIRYRFSFNSGFYYPKEKID